MQKMVIYTSELLRTTKNTACVAEAIHNTLESLQIEHRELKNTNDYWCRDYMPVMIFEDGVYSKISIGQIIYLRIKNTIRI